MLTKADRLEWWTHRPDGLLVVTKKQDIECSPLGVSSVVANVAKSLLNMWPRYLKSSDSSTESGCSNDSTSDTFSVPDHEPESVLPWDQWESGQVRRCS